MHQLLLLSPSSSCFKTFIILWKSLRTCLSLLFHWFSLWDDTFLLLILFSFYGEFLLFSFYWEFFDGLYSSYFQNLHSLYQSFRDRIEITNYNWYNPHFHVPRFFSFSRQSQSAYNASRFLSILLCDLIRTANPQLGKFSSLSWEADILNTGQLVLYESIELSQRCKNRTQHQCYAKQAG